MNHLTKYTSYLTLILFLTLSVQGTELLAQHQDQNTYSADLIIYGGTSAAVTAAVQAARMGKSVILVSPDTHLGGLTQTGESPFA